MKQKLFKIFGVNFILLILFCISLDSITLLTDDVDEVVSINSFLMNQKGDFFLFSSKQGIILKFSKDGKFEKSFCRKGQGPGEINRVLKMFHNPLNDNLYLPEFYSGTRGIHIFSSDGQFVGKMKLDMEEKKKNKVSNLLFTSDGSVFVSTTERVNWKPYGKFFITQNEFLVQSFDKNGKHVADVYKSLLDDEISNKIRFGGPRVLFKPEILLQLTPQDDVAIAKNNDNLVHIYTQKGKLVKKINLDIQKEKLTESEFEIAKKNYINRLSIISDNRMVALAKKMPKQAYKPIFTKLFTSEDFIFVEKIKEEDEFQNVKRSQLILFNWKGERVKTISQTGQVELIIGKTLLIKYVDEEGEEHFKAIPLKDSNM
jgi:hypothetical protein